MRLVLFIHFVGQCLWIGGGLAAMIVAIGARTETPAIRAAAHRLLARVHSMVIGLGALLVVASGLLLTMHLATTGRSDALSLPYMAVMQATGLLGGVLVLFVGLPAAVKLSGVAVTDEAGTFPPEFEKYRKRSAMANALGGTLALIALFSATVLR